MGKEPAQAKGYPEIYFRKGNRLITSAEHNPGRQETVEKSDISGIRVTRPQGGTRAF